MSLMNDSTLGDFLASSSTPRDAKTIALMLKAMGVESYEPRVLNMLLEFMHRYVSEMLVDAQLYAEHAGRADMDVADVSLAIQSRLSYCFQQPPPRELASSTNSLPLSVLPASTSVQLPCEDYCLTAPNYQLPPVPNAPLENPVNAPPPVRRPAIALQVTKKTKQKPAQAPSQ